MTPAQKLTFDRYYAEALETLPAKEPSLRSDAAKLDERARFVAFFMTACGGEDWYIRVPLRRW